jgi:amino acid adenylation domain-containing protein
VKNNQNNIAKLFEEQALTLPDKAVLSFQDNLLTYNKLNDECNKVANFLIDHGFSGQHIGVSLHRSPEILIALLGILKAGCTYIFIDPTYPVQRMRYVLENSGIKLLLTSTKVYTTHKGIAIPVKFVSEVILLENNTVNPLISISSDTPAYIMYTSGTTGKPKGMVITHGNVISYLEAIRPLFNLSKEDIYMHTASFAFSSSVRQFLLPLLNGATLCIATEGQVISLIQLLELIKRNGVTIVDSTQMLWKYGLMQVARLSQIEKKLLFDSKLRLLILSGDLFPASLAQQIIQIYGSAIKIINVCGQTEALGALAYSLPGNFTQATGIVPVGWPLSNTKIFVLDENMSPVKEGEVGELYISSPSVGPGYYKNDELTHKVFIDNQFINNTSFRLLKTGDLVCFWQKGPIEIIGRTDFQVKVRGIRIDVNEIESVIIKHPFIKDCVVTGIRNTSDDLVLVGFIVTNDNIDIDFSSVKQYLKENLPESYIPEILTAIDKIPVSPNGKVDRKLLQKFAEIKIYKEEQVVNHSFSNEVEKAIYNLYARVLNKMDFGLTDSFFDIGGQSLSAVELVGLMEKVFCKHVPVELVYKHSSVTDLAEVIENLDMQSDSNNLVGIQPLGSTEPFICVHGDDANFFLPKYLGEDIPFFGYFHQGRNGERIKFTSIQLIAERYAEELLKLKPCGPYILGGYSIGGVIAYAMVEVIRKRGEVVNMLVLIDSESPQYYGNRIAGRHLFTSNENQVENQEDTTLQKVYLFSQLKEIISDRFFKYGYYISLFFLTLGFKVPLVLRNSYIMGEYRKGRKHFQPLMTDINTILIRSTTDNFEDFDLGWSRFITGDLKIYEIDSDHNSLVKEPWVRKLAEIIRSVIHEPDQFFRIK